MATIGFIAHHERAEAETIARDAIGGLVADGHDVRTLAGEGGPSLSEWAVGTDELAEGLDLAVSVGGDGTMLRTVDLVCGAGVPVLGVNVGHLGYLSAVEPDGLADALRRFLDGRYEIEERMTLRVAVTRDGTTTTFAALNEAVVEKTVSGHTVRLAVRVNGEPFTTYAADGLIVATPTGSTAYNLSARGPIVSPRHRALLVTPVSPHMLFDRTLVLDQSETVDLTVIDGRRAALVLDGRDYGELGAGDAVACSAGSVDARLVSFGRRDFHRILKAKFGLADR